MARDVIDDFSEDSIAEIAKVVRTLRWQVQNVMELAKQLKRHRPTHEIRTGLMKAPEGGQYPTMGCVLPVQFTDEDFAETIGECDALVTTPWQSKFVVGRTYGGNYIPEDTHVLMVKVASTKGRRWWIINPSTGGGIVFKMVDDRTREVFEGKYFGRANAIIQDVYGDVPNQIGEQVEIRFADRLWLGAVEGCEGLADFYGGEVPYVVKECQELALFINGAIDRDRDPNESDDDVPFALSSFHGAANAVYPPFGWLSTGGQNNGAKVRYPGLKWPRALQDARFTATLDVDYNNTTDNFTMHYRVIESDQMTTRIFANFPKFCPDDSKVPSSVQAMNFHPFSQKPPNTGLMVHDVHGHASMGGPGQAEWDEPTERWIITQERLEELTFLTPGDDGANGCPTIRQQKVAVGRCVLEESFLEFSQQSTLESVSIEADECGIKLMGTFGSFCGISGGGDDQQDPVELSSLALSKTKAITSLSLDKGEVASGSGSGTTCNPKLRMHWGYFLTLAGCTEGSDYDEFDLAATKAIVAFDADGCPIWSDQSLLVFGTCDDLTLYEADCDPCPEDESGTGSG